MAWSNKDTQTFDESFNFLYVQQQNARHANCETKVHKGDRTQVHRIIKKKKVYSNGSDACQIGTSNNTIQPKSKDSHKTICKWP